MIGLASCGGGEGALSVSGCDPFDEPVVISDSFTPYENQLSHLDLIPLLPVEAGEAFASGLGDVKTVDGRDLVLTQVSGNTMAQYFGDSLGATDTYADLILEGGIYLETVIVPEGDDAVAFMTQTFGDRGQPLIVGGYPGLLSRDDPSDPSNTRPHRVSWFDGEFQYSLVSDRPANEVVDLARSLEC